eukprot:TRINITY_DN28384_c0_g1_i1.p1 TRINITY_DN28384_c0_g1~~TRINITY_DN28384_c0_g1_i1.p1  ORF type:complete len:309 (-),score=37.01 TRINITY_DN28384_c0_g1_i1:142-1068(-)
MFRKVVAVASVAFCRNASAAIVSGYMSSPPGANLGSQDNAKSPQPAKGRPYANDSMFWASCLPAQRDVSHEGGSCFCGATSIFGDTEIQEERRPAYPRAEVLDATPAGEDCLLTDRRSEELVAHLVVESKGGGSGAGSRESRDTAASKGPERPAAAKVLDTEESANVEGQDETASQSNSTGDESKTSALGGRKMTEPMAACGGDGGVVGEKLNEMYCVPIAELPEPPEEHVFIELENVPAVAPPSPLEEAEDIEALPKRVHTTDSMLRRQVSMQYRRHWWKIVVALLGTNAVFLTVSAVLAFFVLTKT